MYACVYACVCVCVWDRGAHNLHMYRCIVYVHAYMCAYVGEVGGGDHKTLEVNLTKDVSSQLKFGFIQVQAVAHLLLPN